MDAWIVRYNESWPHSGKYCFVKTPMETFRSARHLAQEKHTGFSFQQKVFPEAILEWL